MLLLIDNYDSFTYNLVHYFRELGVDVCVYRNDALSVADITRMQPRWIVISPGPCTPNESGISLAVIQHFAEHIPLLGVCLGHQAIAQVFGARIIHAKTIMHGKTSVIEHDAQQLFANLPRPLTVMRYHSLIVDPHSLPDTLRITAWTTPSDGSAAEIMGIQHKIHPIVGVQFHPESILTAAGHQLLANFLALRNNAIVHTDGVQQL